MTAGRLLLLAVLGLGGQTQSPVSPSRALIDQGIAHSSAGRMDEAVRLLREAVAVATDQSQRGHALRALAQVTSLRGDLAGANALFEEALSAFRDAAIRWPSAPSGVSAGTRPIAGERWTRPSAAGSNRCESPNRSAVSPDQANALRNLSFLARLSRQDRIALLDEAWWMAGRDGERDQYLAGLIRESQSGAFLATGDYATATAHAEAAVRLLEATSPRSLHFARSLTNLGRMKRLMGDRVAGSRIESTGYSPVGGRARFRRCRPAAHISANALRELKGMVEYSRMMDRALVYAQQSTRATTLPYVLTNYAQTLADSGAAYVARAQELIGRVDGTYADAWRAHRARASILNRLERFDDAMAAVDRAMAVHIDPTMNDQALLHVERSIALEGLGRTGEAIESLGRRSRSSSRAGSGSFRPMRRATATPSDGDTRCPATCSCSRRMGGWRRPSWPPNGRAPGRSSICWPRNSMKPRSAGASPRPRLRHGRRRWRCAARIGSRR